MIIFCPICDAVAEADELDEGFVHDPENDAWAKACPECTRHEALLRIGNYFWDEYDGAPDGGGVREEIEELAIWLAGTSYAPAVWDVYQHAQEVARKARAA